MYTTVLFGALLSTVLGAPLVARQDIAGWKPAEGTSATCNTTADKYISLEVGPEQGDVIFDHACAGVLPGCAYPETLPKDTVCKQTIDFRLDGPKNKTLNALVERKDDHGKLSNWAVNFAVTPAEQPETFPGVFMTKDDCKGYFRELLLKTGSEGCYMQGLGPSSGTLAVGGTSSLKNTIFAVSFVERK